MNVNVNCLSEDYYKQKRLLINKRKEFLLTKFTPEEIETIVKTDVTYQSKFSVFSLDTAVDYLARTWKNPEWESSFNS